MFLCFGIVLLVGSYLRVNFKIIKQKDGKNRGFAFVTMASGEEAQAAIEKYDSYVSSFRSLKFLNYSISIYSPSVSSLDCA